MVNIALIATEEMRCVKLVDLREGDFDDSVAYHVDTDIYSSVSPRCFTLQSLYPPSKGLKSHLDKAKLDGSTEQCSIQHLAMERDFRACLGKIREVNCGRERIASDQSTL